MRKLLTFAIFVAIVAAAGYFLLFATDDNKVAEQQRDNALRWAIQDRMAAAGSFEPLYLVIGAQVEQKQWEFRSMVARPAGDILAVGVIEQTCNRPLQKPECWRIAALKLDGRDWSGEGNQDSETASTEPATPANAPAATGADAQSTAAVAQPTVEPQPQPEAAAPAPAPEIEIWRTSRSVVNARKGPGTNFPIVTRITPAFNLTMVSKEAGWGQFEVIEPDRLQGQIIWVWLDLVSRVDG